MNCPVCRETALVMSERSGIEIDYCPQCRGVWLDRGELDKIIERAAPSNAAWEQPATAPSPVLPQTPPAPTFPPRPPQHRPHYDDDDDDYKYRKRRKGGFLGELFDFD
jgi:Zn-finger nucleic acid-binding protein